MMKEVHVEVHLPGQPVERVFGALCDFSAYPELCAAVLSVQVEPVGEDQVLSSWEVSFQGGVLKWQERDRFDRAHHTIHFEQVAGDIEQFSGCWCVSHDGHGSTVRFDASFDLGIPMLADMLDPVAAQTIENNVQSIIDGLFASYAVKEA
jgi:ribosome-associated toxin RatA of RatAB toxin-antitoxin module